MSVSHSLFTYLENQDILINIIGWLLDKKQTTRLSSFPFSHLLFPSLKVDSVYIASQILGTWNALSQNEMFKDQGYQPLLAVRLWVWACYSISLSSASSSIKCDHLTCLTRLLWMLNEAAENISPTEAMCKRFLYISFPRPNPVGDRPGEDPSISQWRMDPSPEVAHCSQGPSRWFPG